MKVDEVLDINGRVPKVGDKIAVAVGWTTNNAYLNIATVDEIIEREKTVKVHLKIEKTGLYGRGEEGARDRKATMIFPMCHCKFMII